LAQRLRKKSAEPLEVIYLSSPSNNEPVHQESGPLAARRLVHTTGGTTPEGRVAPLAVNPAVE
jgi:hypothetical protein